MIGYCRNFITADKIDKAKYTETRMLKWPCSYVVFIDRDTLSVKMDILICQVSTKFAKKLDKIVKIVKIDKICKIFITKLSSGIRLRVPLSLWLEPNLI